MERDASNDGELPRTGEGGAAVTLVDGSDFCLSGRNGDIQAGRAHGLFVLDTRFISRLELQVAGRTVEALGVSVDEPNEATFFGRVDRDLVVLRKRSARGGLTEHITIRNHSMNERTVTVDIVIDADFADVFEVKELRVERRGRYDYEAAPGEIRLSRHLDDTERGVRVLLSGEPVLDGGQASWPLRLAPGQQWATEVRVVPDVQGERVPSFPPPGMVSWRARTPRMASDDPTLTQAVDRALEDLGSLRPPVVE